MQHEVDYCVFIARLQPFHSGHYKVIEQALLTANKVIVLIGSAKQSVNIRNPFTYEEREELLRTWFTELENKRIICAPLLDHPYNDTLWIENVQSIVRGIVTSDSVDTNDLKIKLIGHKKDHTSYYLSLFPQWGDVTVGNYLGLNATDIRKRFFVPTNDHSEIHYIVDCLYDDNYINKTSSNWLKKYARENPNFTKIVKEMEFIKAYKEMWRYTPYPVTFVTTDAVVVQSGHVLLIKRKSTPGLGTWALPGGFLEQNERLIDSCLRELDEETKIKLPRKVLLGSLVNQLVYDDPNRSDRGRTVTHAFYFLLENKPFLPKVRADTDAEIAKWIPISELTPDMMFEDHWAILHDILQKSDKR